MKKEYIAEDLPYYQNPPVTEVAFGLIFKPLEKFLVPHVGLLWEKYRRDYPELKEVAPLLPITENLDGPATIQLDPMPFPRIWFGTKENDGLIQIQRDRFHFNWRKVSPDAIYPRYMVIVQDFARHLEKFRTFLKENSLGEIEPIQFELTYVNTILAGEGWDGPASINSILPDFDWRTENKKLLPPPEAIFWRFAFPMPEGAGRLHVTIRDGKRPIDNKPLLLAELTARGFTDDKSEDAMWKWFGIARKWIVEGFTDLTSSHLHEKVWRRQQ